jgi:hypothetical protein
MLIHLMIHMIMVNYYSDKIEYLFTSLLDSSQAESGISEYLRNRCPLCFGGVNWQQPEEMWV